MDYLIFTVLLIGCIAYVVTKSKKAKKTMAFQTQSTVVPPLESTMKEAVHERLPFAERLNKTKALYPFTNWRANFFEYDMEQYTEENCAIAQEIFDTLISNLIAIGENGNKKDKESCFETAIIALNELNETDEGIIETGEREDLCELIDQITLASGLDPKEYADGEGISDLWRAW